MLRSFLLLDPSVRPLREAGTKKGTEQEKKKGKWRSGWRKGGVTAGGSAAAPAPEPPPPPLTGGYGIRASEAKRRREAEDSCGRRFLSGPSGRILILFVNRLHGPFHWAAIAGTEALEHHRSA